MQSTPVAPLRTRLRDVSELRPWARMRVLPNGQLVLEDRFFEGLRRALSGDSRETTIAALARLANEAEQNSVAIDFADGVRQGIARLRCTTYEKARPSIRNSLSEIEDRMAQIHVKAHATSAAGRVGALLLRNTL